MSDFTGSRSKMLFSRSDWATKEEVKELREIVHRLEQELNKIKEENGLN